MVKLNKNSKKCVDFINNNLVNKLNISLDYKIIEKLFINIKTEHNKVYNSVKINYPICLKKKTYNLLDEKGNILWILKKIDKIMPHEFQKSSIIKTIIDSNNCLNENECHKLLDDNIHQIIDIIQPIINNSEYNSHFKILFDKFPKEIYSDIYTGRFISSSIKKNVEEHLHYLSIFNEIYDNNQYKLNIIQDKCNILSDYVKNILSGIISINQLVNKRPIPIEIKLFLTEEKKLLPINKYDTLGSNNVNTGATYRGDCSSIIIWRKEESAKVIYHEMAHCLSLDFDMPDKIITKIRQMFDLPSDIEIRIYESYVEMWGLIFNSSFISNLLNINIKTVISHEISFSLFQVAKILNHFGFQSWKQFYKPDILYKNQTTYTNIKPIFKQKSSIFSYYIIKASLLYHIDDFINWCYTNINTNDNSIPINFTDFKNGSNYDKYYDLIKFCCDDIHFQESIDLILHSYGDLFNNCNINDKNFLRNTLRMTCYEI